MNNLNSTYYNSPNAPLSATQLGYAQAPPPTPATTLDTDITYILNMAQELENSLGYIGSVLAPGGGGDCQAGQSGKEEILTFPRKVALAIGSLERAVASKGMIQQRLGF